MAKISTYPNDNNVTLSDKLIGTDYENNNETKNFTIGSISSLILSQLNVVEVLNGYSTVNQLPSGLNSPLQVTFGGAQNSSSDPVMIDSLGNITFNEDGFYIVNGYGSVERQGSSGGVSILLFRGLLNGTQFTSTKGFHLDTPSLPSPYEVTFPFQANAGDILTFEIMRDSSGNNNGGLYPHINSGGWSNVPSSQIVVWKVE